MGCLGGCFAFWLLFAVVGASLSYYENDIYDDSNCKIVTLSSTYGTFDKKHITDSNGQSVYITKVKLIQQYSGIRCQLDQTYFILDSAVKAKNGCHGKFKVCFDSSGYVGPDTYDITVSPGCQVVRLLSRLNREAWKFVNAPVSSMRVARQFKEGTACLRHENFGFYDRKVYAKGACRADFEVCFHYGSAGDNSGYYSKYHDYNGYNGNANCQIIVLESWGPGENDAKSVPGNPWGTYSTTMELLMQKSSAPCIYGQTYYARGNKVYATNGCQGKFRVCSN